MKPMLRQEFAMLHEDLLPMTEEQYITVVLLSLNDIEKGCHHYGFLNCAEVVARAKRELLHIQPDFQATQPALERASSAPVLNEHYIDFVTYDNEKKQIVMNLPKG